MLQKLVCQTTDPEKTCLHLGLSAGLDQTGVAESCWAIEKVEQAAQAYRRNADHCTVFTDDCNVLLKQVMQVTSVVQLLCHKKYYYHDLLWLNWLLLLELRRGWGPQPIQIQDHAWATAKNVTILLQHWTFLGWDP